MLSIDEAIAHARAVADTCECEASKYDMSDSYEREVAYQEGKCAEEHEQLAEWLEELKAIKDGSIPIIHGKAELELHDKAIRNEAIDEFARKLHKGCSEMIKQTWGSNTAPISWAEAYADFKVDIDEIAEELKEKNR